jgi:hypothetical protein
MMFKGSVQRNHSSGAGGFDRLRQAAGDAGFKHAPGHLDEAALGIIISYVQSQYDPAGGCQGADCRSRQRQRPFDLAVPAIPGSTADLTGHVRQIVTVHASMIHQHPRGRTIARKQTSARLAAEAGIRAKRGAA